MTIKKTTITLRNNGIRKIHEIVSDYFMNDDVSLESIIENYENCYEENYISYYPVDKLIYGLVSADNF